MKNIVLKIAVAVAAFLGILAGCAPLWEWENVQLFSRKH